MMPKISEEHAEARRDQILNAAIACFAQKGFHKTSMKDICQQADLSPGAVYSYFAGKDEIIEAVCRGGAEQNAAIFQAAAEQGQSPREQIEANLNGYRQLMKMPDIDQWVRADIMFYAESLTNKKLGKMGEKNLQGVYDTLMAAVRRWQQAGFIRSDLSADAVTRVFISVIQGLSLQRSMDNSIDIDAFFDVFKALVFGEFNP